MKTKPLHRRIVKDGDGTHSIFANDLRQFLPARIPKKIRSKKNIAAT